MGRKEMLNDGLDVPDRATDLGSMDTMQEGERLNIDAEPFREVFPDRKRI